MQLQVNFTTRGTTLIIGIEGEIDQHSADYLKRKIDGEAMKASVKNIIFDFSRVSFMDSSGIGIIMGRYKNIQKFNGKAALANVSPQTRRIFEMSGLLRFVPVFATLDEAVKKM
jgi:stage II sporulation protein AA (anti-sigma F factor antagonist)